MCGVKLGEALQREGWRISAARLYVRPARERAFAMQVGGSVVAQGGRQAIVTNERWIYFKGQYLVVTGLMK